MGQHAEESRKSACWWALARPTTPCQRWGPCSHPSHTKEARFTSFLCLLQTLLTSRVILLASAQKVRHGASNTLLYGSRRFP